MSELLFQKCRTLAVLKYNPKYGREVSSPEILDQMYAVMHHVIPKTSKVYLESDVPFSEEEYVKLWTNYYKIDLAFYKRTGDIVNQVMNDLKGIAKSKWFFVTVGFDDNLPNIVQNLQIFRDKMVRTPGMEFHSHVIEKFRRNEQGDEYVHHHIHFLLESDSPKSKVLQFFYQKAKPYIAGKNFVDVKEKVDFDRYAKYISGDKQDAKRACVDKDRVWRSENNILC